MGFKSMTVKDYFRDSAESISQENWIWLRRLSVLYLPCLILYYICVCRPQNVKAQTAAVLTAAAFQTVYSAVIWMIRKRPSPRTVEVFIWIYSVAVMSIGIFLGTVAFPDKQALIFPLFLIMMSQFYTMHPVRLTFVLFVYTAVFLTLSFALKPFDVFLLDVLSNIIAFTITQIASYSLIKYKLEKANIQNKLEMLSTYDSLTSVLNKNAFASEYESLITELDEDDCFAIGIADVDNFKKINDNNGHIVGDSILQAFSKLLESCFSDKELNSRIGRFGGDEFVVMISGKDSCSKAETLFGDFVDKVKLIKSGIDPAVTCSLGVVVAKGGGHELTKLLDAADELMYSVKRNGGNGVKIKAFQNA